MRGGDVESALPRSVRCDNRSRRALRGCPIGARRHDRLCRAGDLTGQAILYEGGMWSLGVVCLVQLFGLQCEETINSNYVKTVSGFAEGCSEEVSGRHESGRERNPLRRQYYYIVSLIPGLLGIVFNNINYTTNVVGKRVGYISEWAI